MKSKKDTPKVYAIRFNASEAQLEKKLINIARRANMSPNQMAKLQLIKAMRGI